MRLGKDHDETQYSHSQYNKTKRGGLLVSSSQPAQGHSSPGRPSSPSSTALSGRPLLVARAGWVAVTLLVLGIFVAGEYLFLVELLEGTGGTACTRGEEACSRYGFLMAGNEEELMDLGLPVALYAAFDATLNSMFVAVWVAVGALVFWHRSDDRMALLVAFFLVTFGPISFGPIAPEFLAEHYEALEVVVEGVEFLGYTSLALFFCLFPSGRFVPRWIRWLAVAYLAALVPVLFFPHSPLDWANRFHVEVYPLGIAPFYLGFVGAQVYRYLRVSTPAERRQTKWVVFGLAVAFGGLITVLLSANLLWPVEEGTITFSLLALWAIVYGFLLVIPLSIGVAILRSGLWDIDLVINRALVYGSLTAMLVALYFGGVVLLQRLFVGLTGGKSTLAVVASTLLIAALFNPLRRHIQSFIDRRFYRSKYDARKTLETFSTKLRDETDLDALSDDLVGVVRETMQPAHVSLWLRPDTASNKGEQKD
jgi:hypothetical protein